MSDVDLLSPEAIADPYPLFDALREDDPVHWSERYRSWIVTRFDDVSGALRDRRFSSDRIVPYRRAKLSGPDVDPEVRSTFAVLEDWMVFKDPPDHTRLRRLLNRAFTPKSVEGMRDRIGELADELIDGLAGSAEADLIGSFAYPLTASVIAEMLGVPKEDRGRFKEWSDQITTLVFGALENPDRYSRAARGMTELADYFSGLVKRYEQAPGDNLVSDLIRARDSGDALSHDEVLATGVLLLFAGHETTTNLIGNGVLALLRHPDQLEELRSGRLDLGQAIEELLRYDGPAKTVVRVMAEDVELRGRRLAAGSRVFLCPPAANRDPAVFSRPNELDLTRRDNPQLGFGFGMHYCLGAPLARLEGGIAITKVLQRLERLRLAGGMLSWQPVLLSRGLKALSVRFEG